MTTTGEMEEWRAERVVARKRSRTGSARLRERLFFLREVKSLCSSKNRLAQRFAAFARVISELRSVQGASLLGGVLLQR